MQWYAPCALHTGIVTGIVSNRQVDHEKLFPPFIQRREWMGKGRHQHLSKDVTTVMLNLACSGMTTAIRGQHSSCDITRTSSSRLGEAPKCISRRTHSAKPRAAAIWRGGDELPLRPVTRQASSAPARQASAKPGSPWHSLSRSNASTSVSSARAARNAAIRLRGVDRGILERRRSPGPGALVTTQPSQAKRN
jgi:hypothetical protein